MSEKEILSAKFDKKDAERIKKIASLRGEDVSSLIRRGALRELAALGLLTQAELRALGLKEEILA